LFFAVSGTRIDGHKFIDQAIQNGATAVVCGQLPEKLNEHVTYVQVEDPALAVGIIASNYYDNPTEKLQLIGVTGTNGKTTIATLLYQLFTGLGFKTGLLSTIKYFIGSKEFPATSTNPKLSSLNALVGFEHWRKPRKRIKAFSWESQFPSLVGTKTVWPGEFPGEFLN